MIIDGKPLVTVITLSYKKYSYIYDAIKSVLEQNYPRIQYIVSDDGASNFPYGDIERYLKKHSGCNIEEFLLLTRNNNVGTVKNLNQAVARAKGKYIIHLSADDIFYDKDVISKIVNDFQKRKCEVLGTLRLRCDGNLNPIRYMPAKFYQKRIMKWDTAQKQYEAFITESYFEMVSGAALSYTKSYWENHHFDESYVLWEDGPFIERYLREGNLLELDYGFTAIYYREGGVSTSNAKNLLIQKDSSLYMNNIYHNIKKMRIINHFTAKLIEKRYTASRREGDLLYRILINTKYFYLVPISLYYRIEQKIIYRVEEWLMKHGISM